MVAFFQIRAPLEVPHEDVVSHKFLFSLHLVKDTFLRLALWSARKLNRELPRHFHPLSLYIGVTQRLHSWKSGTLLNHMQREDTAILYCESDQKSECADSLTFCQ